SALEVGNDALELVPALAAPAAVGEVGEVDQLALAAVQDRLLHVLVQVLPGQVDAEGVVPGQGGDELEVVGVAAVPAAHGAGGQRQLRVHDHARGVEELRHAQAVAGRAGAHRRIEGEQARLE